MDHENEFYKRLYTHPLEYINVRVYSDDMLVSPSDKTIFILIHGIYYKCMLTYYNQGYNNFNNRSYEYDFTFEVIEATELSSKEINRIKLLEPTRIISIFDSPHVVVIHVSIPVEMVDNRFSRCDPIKKESWFKRFFKNIFIR